MDGKRVQVVTDSVAWLPSSLASDLGIRVVPLHVSFGAEQFTETVDITNHVFYQRLQESRELPKTSQPSAGEFLEAYRQAAAAGAQSIVSIHVSSKLSGTFRSAEMAAAAFAEERPDVPIECIDTLQAATAEGIVAVRAAEAAARGATLEEVVAETRALLPKQRVLVVVETLEYLQKGGRIGRAQALLGGLLRIRPILTLIDGEVAPKERARTRARAMERLVALAGDYALGRPLGHLGIFHATAPDAAAELSEQFHSQFAVQRLILSELGPVIGTYLGPGALGVTFHCD